LAIIVPFKVFNDAGQPIFDNDFAIDTIARPAGYVMRNGTLRLFYTTANGLNYGLSISGYEIILDAQLRYKQ
jgi:hypothetical protein